MPSPGSIGGFREIPDWWVVPDNEAYLMHFCCSAYGNTRQSDLSIELCIMI
jgi:hypothetical protein